MLFEEPAQSDVLAMHASNRETAGGIHPGIRTLHRTHCAGAAIAGEARAHESRSHAQWFYIANSHTAERLGR